ncbi:hypothetical protein WA588_000549 [Blastocystis sp. NMH]
MAQRVVTRTLINLADIPKFGTSALGNRISLWKGDITSLKVQCIVNDVNTDFSKPKAVTRVINKNGGHGLINDYSRLKRCPVGKAVIGCGFDLPCDYVIHTASPVVSYTRIHATEEDATKLKECYAESMSLCAKKGIKSVAFPCLGTRSHRYPLEEASKVEAEELIRSLSENATVERVIL